MSSEGYRGSLPPRKDRLAAPWVVVASVVFVLIFIVAFAGVPSKLFPQPTPGPFGPASVAPSASGGASASGSASGSAGPSASASTIASTSASASSSASVAASPSPTP
jgi:hypothetical protein